MCLIVLATANVCCLAYANEAPSRKKPNVISLNSKQVEVSMKELERNYSSKLAKKVR